MNTLQQNIDLYVSMATDVQHRNHENAKEIIHYYGKIATNPKSATVTTEQYAKLLSTMGPDEVFGHMKMGQIVEGALECMLKEDKEMPLNEKLAKTYLEALKEHNESYRNAAKEIGNDS